VSDWITAFCGAVIAAAGGSAALTVTGASEAACASVAVARSVAPGDAADTVVTCGVGPATDEAVVACADFPTTDEASAAGRDVGGAGARRGGSKLSGSTYPCGSLVTRAPKYTYGSVRSTTPLGPTVPTTDASPTSAPRATPIDPRWTSVAV
jgi:hypothetical protein